MIKNLWSRVVFQCGNHDSKEHIKLFYHEPSFKEASMFYSCPKYYPDKRVDGEKACFNRLSFEDAEKIIQKLSDIIESDENSGFIGNYTGLSYQVKFLKVTVVYYSDNKIILRVLNTKSISKK